MSLNLSWWKKNWPRVLWGVLGVLVLLFLVRVIFWEHEYYRSKEGSERAVAPVTSNVDENDVTDDQKAAYTVAPDRPRYISINRLNVKNARVLGLGINNKGEIDTPANIFDTAWYTSSGKPGAGGTMIINGHNGGPTRDGVFKHLPDLTNGDVVVIERGDGQIFKYKVVESNTIPLDQADDYMATAQRSPEKGKESLTLISCTGQWSQAQQTYLSRQFVRAVLIDN